jgi:hypothetical protein
MAAKAAKPAATRLGLTLDRNQIRRGVVLAELLGPPLALRRPDADRTFGSPIGE